MLWGIAADVFGGCVSGLSKPAAYSPKSGIALEGGN
jgi:hypothetical protein